ncbi:MAG: hypothetical protein JJU34_17435 [Lunatimonas sp.]|uniref:hypothetical protein n=1 Tax=Lunatimonas sp. TaxID=2060141 RepID=UPI00263B4EB2|nr:hypothetical protein [Lunatimonas sp.]MCC5939066.1 hypothetical protein [Lunatimonas sp.]
MRFLWLSIFLTIACAKPSDRERVAELPVELMLVPVDSMEIPFIGKPVVHDIYPGARRILFMDHREFGEEIFVADFEGNILHSYTKFGDVPDRYGALMAPLTFMDNHHFLAYGFVGFNTYELSGKLVSSVKEEKMEPHAFAQRTFGRSFAKHGNRLLYFDQGSRTRENEGPTSYEAVHLLKWLDPSTGKKEIFANFPTGSLFKNGKYFPSGSWWPAFCISDGFIYVAYGIEPVVYLYDADPPHELISQFKPSLKDYHYFQGSENAEVGTDIGLFLLGGKIESIVRFNEFLLISYFPGYSPADVSAFQENMGVEERIVLRERMDEKYKRRLWIGDLEGNTLGDFVPEVFQANNIGVREGELFAIGAENPAREEDLFRIYRLDISESTFRDTE